MRCFSCLFLFQYRSLCNIFASPWADSPCRPQDIDCNVPQEYLIHTAIKDKVCESESELCDVIVRCVWVRYVGCVRVRMRCEGDSELCEGVNEV